MDLPENKQAGAAAAENGLLDQAEVALSMAALIQRFTVTCLLSS